MTNRRLNNDELSHARSLLKEINKRIDELAGGDAELRFAYNRKVYKELIYVERGTPAHRRKLKALMFQLQDGACQSCKQSMEIAYSVLDRKRASLGYTQQNVELICMSCDVSRQKDRGYS